MTSSPQEEAPALDKADELLEQVEDLDRKLSEAIRALMQLTAKASPFDRAYIQERYQILLDSRKERFATFLRVDLAKPVDVGVDDPPNAYARFIMKMQGDAKEISDKAIVEIESLKDRKK